jgi:hypothetical protein
MAQGPAEPRGRRVPTGGQRPHRKHLVLRGSYPKDLHVRKSIQLLLSARHACFSLGAACACYLAARR